ncbi:hypothetical protein, partial [Streptomyces sp. NPDC058964]|uniref:hypothetical protein n=1 Tax=Streptomyces sp. NPDC058964 TaxID=3346681 RepID=UPI003697E243
MADVRVKSRRESVLAHGVSPARADPSAWERFGVFAECLLTGVWIAVASLGVVTYPAALAAGARHLRRRTAHEGGGLREFVSDFRAAVRGGWVAGLAGWAAAAVAWVDVRAVRAGLPGGPVVGAVGLFALIGLAVAGLRAATVWMPGDTWRALLVAAGRRTVLDPPGSHLRVGGAGHGGGAALLSAPLAVP